MNMSATPRKRLVNYWTIVWVLPFVVLLLMLCRAPLVGLVHREVGTRVFLQAVIPSDQASSSYRWQVMVKDAQALEVARWHLSEANSHLDIQGSQWNTCRTLGLVELSIGHVPDAQRLFLCRLEAVPDDRFARFFLGETYLRSDEPYRAIEQWEAAGARTPLMWLGETLQQSGRLKEAIAAFDAVSRLDPTDLQSRKAAALLIEEIDTQQALARYQEIMAIAPEWDFGYAHYGRILFQEKQYERAIPFFEQALRCKPVTPAWILELLGRSHAALGRWEQAAMAYEQAIHANPTLLEAYRLMGDAQCELGHPEVARAYYEQAIMLGYPDTHLQPVIQYIIQRGECPSRK